LELGRASGATSKTFDLNRFAGGRRQSRNRKQSTVKLALTKRSDLIEISRPKHLKTLASRIERQLQTGESKQCAIYEDELQRLWPPSEKDREAKIAQFANEYGFRLRFYKKGLCAIFDNPAKGAAELGHLRRDF
jgi:hypothetical protein